MVMRYLGGINNPSYNPLAANVTTGVTTVQQGGIYTSSSASQNVPLGRWLDDQYFNQTTLLLQADNAVNGAQNNTFIDSSVNNFTVTRNGNATQGSFSPFSEPNGYWSNFFDGAGDYFNVIGSSNLAFGTNNFTIEAWVYFTSTANQQIIYDARPASTSGAYAVIYLPSASGKIGYYVSSADRILSNNPATLNKWTHVAISRVSGTTRMFIDGVVQTQTWTDTTTYLNGANRPAVGVYGDVQNAGYMTGYISNLRALNGTGLYTTSFTPPTEPLTAIANTQLLTCQSNRLVDNSANAYAITRNGDVAARPFSAFNNNVPQFNGPTGTGSVFFKGYDNYALINQSLIPATQQEFTIEGWIYLTGNDAALYPVLICDDAIGDFNWTFGVGPSNYLGFWWRTGLNTYDSITGTTALSFNTWYYVAVSASATNIRLYVNGVMDMPTPGGLSTRFQVDNRTVIGGISNTSASFMFQGLVSNLSVTNGVGKYSGSSFTIPTGPSPAVATGQVLLFASPFAVDSNATVAPKTVTITGQVTNNIGSPFATSPVTFPNAGGAAYFDGTGDYLTLTGSSNLAFGTGDFTIECWFYLNALPVSPAGSFIYDSRPAADGAYPCFFVAPTTNVLTYYVNTAARITGATAVTTGQWNYVVVSRVSGSTRLFLNGAQQGSTYTDTTNYLNGASRPVIANNGLNLGGPLTGYISNLRVIKGAGVTSVTVPTAPLVPIANTQLLLNGTNAGISDGTNINYFETVGNAQVSTAIKKYGSGSMYFDGTGDWLLAANNPDINFGTGDFTVECWLNISNTTTTRHLIGKGTASTGWAIYFNAQPTLLIFEHGGSISYSSNYNLITGQWYHIAVVRSGTGIGNIKMFINGFLIFESATAINTDLTTLQPLYIGASRTATNPMFGYVDDLRITKGVARYTSTFNPPTVALPRQG